MSTSRVAIIGVDCLTPQLLFERHAGELPAFARLREQGAWGTLTSTVPPITVPAWMCMATSQDPGQLGVYGFRNRRDHSYDELKVADASWLPAAPSLWQLLSRRRRPSLVLGVPMTYPARPIVGAMVSGVPVPEDAQDYAWPAPLRAELDAWAGPGGYEVDVRDFRQAASAELLARLHRLREARFDVAEGLCASRPWDLLFMVEMGVDRLHHAFWASCDPAHPEHVPGNPLEHAIRDYYRALDARVGRLVEKLGEQTAVLIVSDHGARGMVGGVRLNEWLVRKGWLALRSRPETLSRLKAEHVDWSRTRAWADGGYYGRIFLNVAGREPQGTISAVSYGRALAELRRELTAMEGPGGTPLANRVFDPTETYRSCRGVPPDLIVYPGDLAYRAQATIFPEPGPPPGDEALFSAENDTGVDGANHAQEGVVLYRPARGEPSVAGLKMAASIYDVAPTVLTLLGERVPEHMIGRSWV